MNMFNYLLDKVFYPVYFAFKDLRGWLSYNFNKSHAKVISESIKGYPFCAYYLLVVEKAKLEELRAYFEPLEFLGDRDKQKILRDITYCIKLLDILTDSKELYNFSGDFKEVEINGRMCIRPENLEYKCFVKVNLRNMDRFLKGDSKNHKEIYQKYPHEIYIMKARNLYHEIRKQCEETWWD